MADILGFPYGPRPGDVCISEVNPNEGPPEIKNAEAWSILQDAANMIEGDRHEQHGKAEKCHDEIAKLWAWWLSIPVDRHDVAILMALLKVARIKTGSYNRDCYSDGDAYLALAGQFRKGDGDGRA